MGFERAKSGLRGRVKSVSEESTSTLNRGEGNTSEFRSESTTDYDVDGRITQRRIRNTDGSYWVTRWEYTSSGQLLETSSGTEGKTLTETHYSYGPQGRLQSIATDGKPETISFRYDESGRKTKIETSGPEDYRPNTANAGSPFDVTDRAPNLPGGGSATTTYDEHDRPLEVQVRDASGELVSHATRTYDADGHVIEEQQVQDSLAAMFPPDAMAKLLQESGLSAAQLQSDMKEKLANLMAGQASMYSVRYSYGSNGQLIHTARRVFNHEDEIDTAYNEHGDLQSEITRSTRPAGDDNSATAQTYYSEVQYSYEYDQQGNWTVKTTSYRSSPDATFQDSIVQKRSLTYY